MEKRLKAAIESMSSDERAVALEQLQRIVGEIELYRSSYFRTPHLDASSRRRSEFDSVENVILGDNKIHFRSRYRESCRCCYYSRTLTYNGAATTTTRLKNIIDFLLDLSDAEKK